MKKIINKPETLVREMCSGIVLAHPELEFIPEYKIIKKREMDAKKITLISGGGSGHEPAHAGFVGKGLLDAAVCGDVFASPSQIQVYQAIKKTANEKGTLLIIKNYSGDMMNFTNAAAMAQEDGVNVDFVRVDDDIAVQDSLYTIGKRGVAGTVLVHKIVGAAAERGMSLKEVKEIAEKAVCNVKSLGVALTSCTVPAKGTPTFQLGDNEMEYGVGIHGEPGIRKEPLIPADALAERLVSEILSQLPLTNNREVAVLINGFGGTPLQELYLFGYSVAQQLCDQNISILKLFIGNYLTSIDMAGVSVSVMNLDEQRKELLGDACHSPALILEKEHETEHKLIPMKKASGTDEQVSYQVQTPSEWARIEDDRISLENIIYMVDHISETIISNEVLFCELDSFAGDGDFGMSVAKGFKQLKKEWAIITACGENSISTFLNNVSMIIMEHCGGASGPIWGSAFRAAAKETKGKEALTLADFADMLQAAVSGIYRTGERSFGKGAVVGDKTLIDALAPCADELSHLAKEGDAIVESLCSGAAAAVVGAEKTKDIVARMGRAGTVGKRSLGHPDAGAYALGVIFSELTQRIRELN